jgi:hypothetical protein
VLEISRGNTDHTRRSAKLRYLCTRRRQTEARPSSPWRHVEAKPGQLMESVPTSVLIALRTLADSLSSWVDAEIAARRDRQDLPVSEAPPTPSNACIHCARPATHQGRCGFHQTSAAVCQVCWTRISDPTRAHNTPKGGPCGATRREDAPLRRNRKG